MPIPSHLTEGDYDKLFPAGLDEFPEVGDDAHYIDAWLLNSAFNSLLAVEQYLIDHKTSIEAPIGDDIIGEEGQFEIPIPSAYYPSYKTCLAWDSNLLEENIKLGESIFGVVGSLDVGVGGLLASLPILWVTPFVIPPSLSLDSSRPVVSVPSTTVS